MVGGGGGTAYVPECAMTPLHSMEKEINEKQLVSKSS